MTRRDDKSMKTILFVCTGNTCRSPMAQGIFNSIAKEKNLDWRAKSAGLAAFSGMPYSKNAVLACEKLHIDIRQGRACSLGEVDPDSIDLFCPMSVSHALALTDIGVDKEKIILLKKDGVCDPYGGDEAVYDACCQEILEAVRNLVQKL